MINRWDVRSYHLSLLTFYWIKPMFQITENQKNELIEEIARLKFEEASLKQKIRQEKQSKEVEMSAFLLELLEVIDSLERLLESFETNDTSSTEYYQRLHRVIGFIYRKLLNILAKQGIEPIETEEGQLLDIALCRVVSSLETTDLPNGSLVTLIKRGYFYKKNVLRSAEVIVAKG